MMMPAQATCLSAVNLSLCNPPVCITRNIVWDVVGPCSSRPYPWDKFILAKPTTRFLELPPHTAAALFPQAVKLREVPSHVNLHKFSPTSSAYQALVGHLVWIYIWVSVLWKFLAFQVGLYGQGDCITFYLRSRTQVLLLVWIPLQCLYYDVHGVPYPSMSGCHMLTEVSKHTYI